MQALMMMETADDERRQEADSFVPINHKIARALARAAELLGRSEEEIIDAALAPLYP